MRDIVVLGKTLIIGNQMRPLRPRRRSVIDAKSATIIKRKTDRRASFFRRTRTESVYDYFAYKRRCNSIIIVNVEKKHK